MTVVWSECKNGCEINYLPIRQFPPKNKNITVTINEWCHTYGKYAQKAECFVHNQ